MSVNFAFLDSGIGGLPYLLFLKEKQPVVNCIYYADTKNFPYGQKTKEQIIENASLAVEKIINKWNPHAIILACNTISVTALEELRTRFPAIPFVGTVPAIKPAAILSKTKKIGLLATNATVNHPYTKELQNKFASDCKIVSRGDPDLISFIEHKFFQATEEERIQAVTPAVDFFRENDCDVIVLACTHFLNMSDYIQKVAGSNIQVIDSREGVVKRALSVESNIKSSCESNNETSMLFVSGFTQENDVQIYTNFCNNIGITFGGYID